MVEQGQSSRSPASNSDGSPSGPDSAIPGGTILEARGDRLRVATGDGILAITELQADGRRPMNTRDFLAGSRLSVGDIFTPAA